MLAALSATVLAGALSLSATAFAASCGKQVVNDWYDNGRVDRIYPLSCYREAIRILPTDVIDYSNAKEEIGRALAYAKQGKDDPGGKPGVAATTPTTPDTAPEQTAPDPTTPEPTTPTEPTPSGTSPDPVTTDVDTVVDAGGEVDTSGPSSVPIPLIVLAGLAILLLAAGSAGYLARRANDRKGGDGPPPASPA